MSERTIAEPGIHLGEPFLELVGIRVFLHESEDDGNPVVQIETPEDSDIHDRVRVYLNDARASRWSDG